MPINMRKFLIISGLSVVLAIQLSAGLGLANNNSISSVSWDKLNLTTTQKAKIKVLDLEWERSSRNLIEKISHDKEQLKALLESPFATEAEIRDLQKRILLNQQELRYRAMNNFLQKRKVLTLCQKKKLHKMLSR